MSISWLVFIVVLVVIAVISNAYNRTIRAHLIEDLTNEGVEPEDIAALLVAYDGDLLKAFEEGEDD